MEDEELFVKSKLFLDILVDGYCQHQPDRNSYLNAVRGINRALSDAMKGHKSEEHDSIGKLIQYDYAVFVKSLKGEGRLEVDPETILFISKLNSYINYWIDKLKQKEGLF